MKKIISFTIVLLSFSTNIAQDFNYNTDFKKLVEDSKGIDSPNNYEKLKDEFIKNGENFTKQKVIALMAGQTASKYYDAYGMIDMERSYQIADKFSSDTIHKYSSEFLKIYPVNFSLNYGLWKTYKKDKDKINAAKYKKRFELIAESILSTGDGSNEKPYFVISPIDGQVLIRLYYKNGIGTMGSGRDPYGNFIDILQMVSKKESKPLSFVINHSMSRFRKQLKAAENKKSEAKYEIDENGRVIPKKKK